MALMMSRWSIFLTLSVMVTALVLLDGIESPIRSAIILGFVLFCPGMVIVRWLRLHDVLAEIAIAVGVSLAMCTITGTVMIYVGRWNPQAGIGFLLIFTLVGTLIAAPIQKHRGYSSSPSLGREAGLPRASK